VHRADRHAPRLRRHYPTTLFAAGEAYAGPCAAKTTIYCANVAAGLMLAQFPKWMRRFPVDPDVSINLLAGEMVCGPSK
jgi:sulfur carrier protein ThiS adenylyltransferase